MDERGPADRTRGVGLANDAGSKSSRSSRISQPSNQPPPSPSQRPFSPDPDIERVSLLALDVDGVLTDGSIYLDDQGIETKRFHVRDGFGIKLWQKMGFEVAILTGRTGQAVQHRMRELGVKLVIQGALDKSQGLEFLLKESRREASELAYIGDDWPDLPVLRRVGYPMSVADGDARAKALSRFVTSANGGHGAVREAIEHLLDRKGLISRALGLYDSP